MDQNVQLALLVGVIIVLYIISSRWRPDDSAQRNVRLSYRIGLVIILLLVLLFTYLRSRHG